MPTLSSCQKDCPGISLKMLPSQVTEVENDYILYDRSKILMQHKLENTKTKENNAISK